MSSLRDLQRAPPSRQTVVDQMNLVNMGEATRAAFGCLDSLQREREGNQLLAVGVLFLLYCKKYGVKPDEVLYKSGSLLTDAQNQNNVHIGAIARFLKVHLAGETSQLF